MGIQFEFNIWQIHFYVHDKQSGDGLKLKHDDTIQSSISPK